MACLAGPALAELNRRVATRHRGCMNKQDAEGQSKSWEKRRHLFETYSRNYGVVKKHPHIHLEPDIENVFVCPLCFGYFTREEVLAGENVEAPVTLEHVPPKALGGRPRTLTCRECNQWSGHALDSHLAHRSRVFDFVHRMPGTSVDAKVTLNDEIALTATVRYSEDRNLQVFLDEKRSDPKEVEKWRHFQQPSLRRMNMTFKGKRRQVYKKRRPECSLLRIAYLWAFSVFGYGFLMNQGVSHIREQIRNPTEEVLPNWGISQRDDFPDQSLGVNIITAPKELRAFLVVFDLRTTHRTVRHGVMLPGPGAAGIRLYEHLGQSSKAGEITPISYKPIPDTDKWLDDPEFCFASDYIWRHWGQTT